MGRGTDGAPQKTETNWVARSGSPSRQKSVWDGIQLATMAIVVRDHLPHTRSLAGPSRGSRRGERVRWSTGLGLLLLAATALAPMQVLTAHAASATSTPADALGTLQAQAEAQRRAIDVLSQREQQAERTQRQREQASESLAIEIERLKSQPEGVARDLALNEKLAQAQAQAAVLSRESAALRQGAAELRLARQRLVALCDRILRTDEESSLTAGQRLLWLRLRTTQVESLLAESRTTPAGSLVGSATAAASAAATASATLDDPQALREQADLLRDSVDKLRREMDRLAARSEELRRRERLRERASRVDEDLFAEQATARRRGSAAALRGGAEAAAPAADSSGGVLGGVPSPNTGVQSPLPSAPRVGPDPSTLDALLRSEGSGDPVTKQQALVRARTELEALASDLLRRAGQLEQRALDLSKQK